MSCPECDGERRRLPVPDELREHAPGGGPAVVVCTTCLRAWSPADAPDVPPGEPGDVSGALPASDGAAAAVLLWAARASSLAGNQAALEALFAAVERAGADPRLALERLADDPELAPAVDLRRRLTQFEGLR
jgi:hypothetical protein